MRRKALLLVVFLLITLCSITLAGEFTQEDRDRLIRLEATLQTFVKQVDKRFEQMDRRITELREDVNKRFEQVDRRIEETNRRIDETNRNIRWLGLLMGGLVAAVIGIVVWDRRTAVRVAVQEAEREFEGKYEPELMKKMLAVLRELAKENKRLAEILRTHGLL